MTYVSGFLLAVPEKNKDTYRDMAVKAWDIFREYGALSLRENWGASVPDGKVTSFGMATKQEPGEVVVFSWIEWPDRATCESAWDAMMNDDRMKDMPDMPFDGQRMMWGGFESLVDLRADESELPRSAAG